MRCGVESSSRLPISVRIPFARQEGFCIDGAGFLSFGQSPLLLLRHGEEFRQSLASSRRHSVRPMILILPIVTHLSGGSTSSRVHNLASLPLFVSPLFNVL